MTLRLHPSVLVPREPETVLFSSVCDPWEPQPAELAWIRRLEPYLKGDLTQAELRQRLPESARPNFDSLISRLLTRGYLTDPEDTIASGTTGVRSVIFEDKQAVWITAESCWPSRQIEQASRMLQHRLPSTSRTPSPRRAEVQEMLDGLLQYKNESAYTDRKLLRLDTVTLDVTSHHFEPRDVIDLRSDAGLSRIVDPWLGLVSHVDEADAVQFPGRISRASTFGAARTVYAAAPTVALSRALAVRHAAMRQVIRERGHTEKIIAIGFAYAASRAAASRTALLDAMSQLDVSPQRNNPDSQGWPLRRQTRPHGSAEISVIALRSALVPAFAVSANGIEVARVADTNLNRARQHALAVADVAQRIGPRMAHEPGVTEIVLDDIEPMSVQPEHHSDVDDLLALLHSADYSARFLSPLTGDAPDDVSDGMLAVELTPAARS